MERLARIELANKPWQGFRLPLHHSRIKVLVKDSEKFWSLSRKTWLPAKTVALYLSSKHGVPFTYKDLPDCNPDL